MKAYAENHEGGFKTQKPKKNLLSAGYIDPTWINKLKKRQKPKKKLNHAVNNDHSGVGIIEKVSSTENRSSAPSTN